MKHVKRNSIIIMILSILFIFYIMKDNFKSTIFWLIKSNKLFLLLAIIIYAISFLIDSYSFKIIINQYHKFYSFKKSIKLNIMTKFFNGITPLSTGGQPMQLYELHKENIKIHDATNIVIQFYIIFQIALVFLSTTAIVLNRCFHMFTQNTVLRNFVIIGYIINFLILIFLFFISFNNKFNEKIISWIIKILAKLNIVKDKEKTFEIWKEKCKNFYISAHKLKENPKSLIIGVILQLIQLLFCYSVPIIVVHAMKIPSNLNIFNTLVASAYIFLVGCYIPIPGGTGGMEFGFMGFFGNFISKGTLSSATILWRFITYYLPVIIGGIVFNYKQTKKIKRKHKNES